MARARAVQAVDYPDGSWREGNGRKPKRDLVRDYAAGHPEASQREISSALGISKTTVNKWLKPGWREEYEEGRRSKLSCYRLSVLCGGGPSVVRDGNGEALDSFNVEGRADFSLKRG